MRHIKVLPMLLYLMAASLITNAAEPVRFIPATRDNTRMANGAVLPQDLGSIGWQWQDGVFSSTDGADASVLTTLAEGLEPGTIHEVFGQFRVQTNPTGPHDAIQLGLSLATMHPFGGARPDDLMQREPWVITPGYKTGEPFGMNATAEAENPLPGFATIRARLGHSRASKDGTLPVFFAPNTGSRSPGIARMTGIAVRRAPADASTDNGRKPGTQLHLAIRAGDPFTLHRELEASADVNAFDEENLTPLFYAAASGNVSLVRKLIAHGANPEHPGQSVPPLTAAATIAHAEIIGILLDNGAKVPNEPTRDKGALASDIDPRLLHPVVASIRSGSVPALKLLMAANTNLNLAELEKAMIAMHAQPKSNLNAIYLLGDTMLRMDWEMAAFLIDHGILITCWGLPSSPEGVMLAYAVHALPDSLPTMDAMLRRGEPVVAKDEYVCEDALNAAAFQGNVDLVRRFLPHAREVGAYYKNCLLEKALYSGNEEIIAMVRNRFPDAQAPRWTPDAKDQESPALEASATRWFLPRTSPPPQARQKPAQGKHVLAVVASPDAQATGELLAAHASQTAAWQVVDRTQIEAALTEARFAKPWSDGEHRLSDLGDRLQADCLIVIRAIRAANETIYRFEVVETTTGLEIHREHLKNNAAADQTEVAGLLGRAAHALDLAGNNTRHQAVTLLTFSEQGRISNQHALTGLLRAAIQHEVDATPGMISMSRAQSARLIEEQAMGGEDSVWGAAHMIEGTLVPEEDGNIRIKLRLETIKAGGATVKTDAEAIGKSTAIAETAAAAWKNLVEATGNQIKAPAALPGDRERALAEGRRLMREADWLHTIHADPASYLPMIESAIALGIPAQDTILIDLDARFRKLFFVHTKDSKAREFSDHHSASLQGLFSMFTSHSLARREHLLHKLPAAREFLHQTSWYLEQLGRDGLNGGTDIFHIYDSYKSNEIWYAIQALSMVRCFIYPGCITEQVRGGFEAFSSELDVLTRRYFSLLKSLPEPDFYRYYLQVTHPHLLKHNPALADGLAEMAASGASVPLLLRLGNNGNRQFQWMLPCKDLARKMIARMEGDTDPRIRLAKADLECFLADAAQRPAAIRRLVEASADARWLTRPSREHSATLLASQEILDASTTSCLLGGRPDDGSSLEHNGSLLPSVLFSAEPAPDLFIRFHTYHKLFHLINQREAWDQNQARTGGNIDPFRASIGAYDQWELARLQSESTRQRPVNGRPIMGNRSTYNAAPMPSSKPEAVILRSMIFGAGKINRKQEQNKKPVTGKPLPAPIQAQLLADLRIGGSPGACTWPLVDRSDPHLLWMFYFPSLDDSIPLGYKNHDHRYKAPWLLGINCHDGSLIRQIDLHAAVGEAYGMDLANRTCNVWRMALDQTSDRILTAVGWHDPAYAGNSNRMCSVIIDKKTGKPHPIPGNPEIQKGISDTLLDLWDRDNGLAAVGEHFFFLNVANEWTGSAIKGIRSNDLAIFQLFPDLSVKPLTMMGRRPELTPFDAQNRAPISITPHGKRLMVVHPSTIAEYDPVAEDWAITASLPSDKPTKKHTNTVADAQYWEHLRSIHELRVDGTSTEWIAVSWVRIPGILPFVSREKGRRDIPIETVIPADFLATTDVIEVIEAKDHTRSIRKTPLKDHVSFKKPWFVVLAQTDSDLILGIHTGAFYNWKHPTRDTHHLPFLWRIPKKKLLETLENNIP